MSESDLALRTTALESTTLELAQVLEKLRLAVGDTADSSAADASTSSSSQAPPGTYVVFVSTQSEPIPYDVIAAYQMASKAIKSKSIRINLVNKQIHKTPSLLTPCKQSITGSYNITRLLYRIAGKEPKSLVDTTIMDNLTQTCCNESTFAKKDALRSFLSILDTRLAYGSYLVGYQASALDLSLFQSLHTSADWLKMSETIRPGHGPFNVLRHYKTLLNSSLVQSAFSYATASSCNSCASGANGPASGKKDGGNAKGGKGGKGGKSGGKGGKNDGKQKGSKGGKAQKVTGSWDIGIDYAKWQGLLCTRFPPEPSGYLHIGHAKAVIMNREIANRYGGTMLVRFDDTNPSKEKAEFVENIARDLQSLGVTPDRPITHTSDYFDIYIKYCRDAIESNLAYADDQDAETIKAQRMKKMASVCRERPTKENLQLWDEMLKGSDIGQKTCIRIKLDPSSDNGTLRDPVIFRCNVNDLHPITKDKYKAYPTYDFACPIADSLEGVTHALRSKEYNERDEQYSRIWDLVCKGKKYKGKELAKPSIYQFARLEFVRTQLSKRKLQKMIDEGKANGWDDPRLPTIQGILRRGLQVEALKQFVFESATSTRNNLQEWDKLWTFNKKILDPIVSRYFAIELGAPENAAKRSKLILENVEDNTCFTVPLVPKIPDGKQKALCVGKELILEEFDLELIRKQNPKKIGMMNLGIVDILKIEKDQIVGRLNSEDKDFKKKQLCTWVTAQVENLVPLTLVELDYLFTSDGEPNNQPTWLETFAYGEPSMRMIKKGEVIQIMKRGFFICDRPYLGRPESPAVLIFVPDGKSSAMSKLASATNKVKIATK